MSPDKPHILNKLFVLPVPFPSHPSLLRTRYSDHSSVTIFDKKSIVPASDSIPQYARLATGGIHVKKQRKNKINRARNLAMFLVFGGMLVMYGGLLLKQFEIIMVILMLVGFVMVLASTALYFLIGLTSTKAAVVTCPNCGKETKVLGRVDLCMHCDEPLTMDRNLEGKEFDEKYNKHSKRAPR